MKYVPPYGSGDPNAPYVNGNPSTGVQGSIPPAAAFEHPLREIVAAIAGAGFTPDETILTQLAHSIQKGMNYAAATGTANAWAIDLPLDIPSYAAGRLLWTIAPATNTSTTVNINVDGKGDRRLKKPSGSDPAIGDLVAGQAYLLLDDGTSFRALSTLPSDITNPGGISALRYLGSTYLSTAGSSTVTPPAGAKSANVELWAGGGGSSDSGASQAINGGGGGEYRRGPITVTAGTPVSYTIGTGGARTTYGATGGAGGDTTIGGITAKGGSGSSLSSVGGGGTGGTGGTLAIPGQTGAAYATATATGGVSGAGGPGSPGIQPGGGGGGPGSGGYSGQPGAAGAILIDWYG